MAKSMFKGKGLPNMFWAEAVATAVYLININRSPTKAVKKRTPYEAWSGRRRSVILESLGQLLMFIFLKKKPKSWMTRKKCIFLGYRNETKGLSNPKKKG